MEDKSIPLLKRRNLRSRLWSDNAVAGVGRILDDAVVDLEFPDGLFGEETEVICFVAGRTVACRRDIETVGVEESLERNDRRAD